MSEGEAYDQRVSMCVIDDIKSVVEGISTQIDWEQHGVAICGTALNGEHGMEIIRTQRPDIILTDIRMPKLNGLDLTRIVREMLPESKVILLTGYSDFENAKLAISLGVFEFITKPFSLEKIEQTVLNAVEAILKQRRRATELLDLKKEAKESLELRRKHYFFSIVHHSISPQNATQQWESLQVELDPKNLIVALFEMDHLNIENDLLSKDEADLLDFTFHNIIEETISNYTKGIVLHEQPNRFITILNVVDHISTQEIVEECCRNMSKYSRFTVSVGLGSEVTSHYELAESYRQALRALSYRFYSGGNAVGSYKDLSMKQIPSSHMLGLEKEFILCLLAGNQEKALSILEDIFLNMMSKKPLPYPEYLKGICYEIAYLMLRTFRDEITDKQFETISSHVRERLMIQAKSFLEMQDSLKDICRFGCALIAEENRPGMAVALDEVILYIKSHLHLELTVSHCAKKIYLSPSYFASQFKRKTGHSFNTYLNELRMEKAKRMLVGTEKIGEIAKSLGYSERRYFSEVFKKNTGLTPSEFREEYRCAEASQ